MKPPVLKALFVAAALISAASPRVAGAAESQETPTPAATPSPAPDLFAAPPGAAPQFFGEEGAAVLRSSERVEDAPGLIAVVDDRQIRERGYRTLADLLRDVPGFYVEPDPRRDVVFTRGVPQSILIVYDGVPLVFDTGRDDLPVGEELSLAHVRRVEVLRGPGTALWGANAFNGIVNVVSDDGRDVAGVRIRAEGAAGGSTLGAGEIAAGSRGTAIEWSLALRGEQMRNERRYLGTPRQYVLIFPVSVPVGQSRDGIGGLAPSHFGEAVGKVAWRKLSVAGRYSEFSSLGALSSYSHSLVEAERDERRRIPTGSFRAAWNESAWSAGAFYLRSIHDDRFPLFAQAPAHRFGGEIDVRARTENFGVDGRGELALGANTLSGGYLVAGKVSTLASDYVDPQTGTKTNNAFRRNFRNSVLQIYGQDRLVLGRWRFTAGASFDQQSDFAASINPRAGLVVKLGRGWIAKTLYGEAIRTPDVFDVIGISGGAAAGNVAAVKGNSGLKPEKIRTAELGADYRRGSIANASLAGFVSRADDLIENQSTAGLVQPVNRGHRFSTGVEALAGLSPIRGVDLHASWTFVRTADTTGDLQSHPLASAPENVVVLGGSWSPLDAMSVYVGNRFVARRALRGTGTGRADRLDAYTTTDANFRYAPRRFPLSAAVQLRNVLDAHYFHRDESVPGRNIAVEIPGERRTVVLTVEGRF